VYVRGIVTHTSARAVDGGNAEHAARHAIHLASCVLDQARARLRAYVLGTLSAVGVDGERCTYARVIHRHASTSTRTRAITETRCRVTRSAMSTLSEANENARAIVTQRDST
jgi:hypothetical protein